VARTYKRDSRGRFAGGGGSSSRGGGRKPMQRGTNRLTRDNSGRITSVGGDGATARGGRLRTASGKQRATQTARISGGRAAGTTAKPRGLKPESSRKLKTGVAVNRMRSINERMGNRPDIAEQNIRGRFSGQAGKRLDASIDRAVKQVKAAQTAALMKPKAQVKAERAAAAEAKRQEAAAKPKRTRTPESLRMSRAKQIEKRRSITTNPAGERASSAAKMAANAARTQERATAFLKAGGKANPTTRAAAAAVKPARKSIGSIDDAKASRIIARLDANRSGIRRATGTARQTANSIRTRERAVAFALAPGARARKRGQNISTNESLQRAVKNASKNRAAKAATSKSTAASAAKPAKGSAAAQKIEQAKGRTKVLTQSKNALNQQLKSINAQIKQAGPSAGGLRLQKLQIQDRLSQLRRDIAASKAAARG